MASDFPILHGLLIDLRELSNDDISDITNLMTSNIARFLWEVPFPYTSENARNFIDSSKSSFKALEGVNFAIEYHNNSKGCKPLIGTISLKGINWASKRAHIGYWIGEQYWGIGLGTESVKLVINYAFSVLQLEKICAYVYPDNKASIRVLEKNRFEKKGKVNEYHKMSGRYRNSLIFVIQNTKVTN